jgi:protein arginine kinase
MFEQMSKKPAVWLSATGASAQVVLSSRVRLARNVAHTPFPSRANADQRERILSFVKSAVEKSGKLSRGTFVDCSRLDELDRTSAATIPRS